VAGISRSFLKSQTFIWPLELPVSTSLCLRKSTQYIEQLSASSENLNYKIMTFFQIFSLSLSNSLTYINFHIAIFTNSPNWFFLCSSKKIKLSILSNRSYILFKCRQSSTRCIICCSIKIIY